MSRLPRPTSSSRSNCSGGDFDWDPALRKLDELNARVEDPTLWDDAAAAQAITRERSKLAASVEAVQSLERDLADAIGYAEMAREDCQDGTELAFSIEQIQSAGARAKDLVRQILAFSRQGDGERQPLQPALILGETLKLLRSGTGRSELQDLDSIMPNGLLDLLEGRALADRSVLDDPREALRLGYRFDSFRDRYQAMFGILRSRLTLPQQAVEDWLDLPAAERRAWFGRADLRASAALLLLEQAALRRQLLLAQEQLKQRYLGARDNPQDRRFVEADATLREILANSGFLSRPAELLSAGYGLPQPAEWQQLEAASSERQLRLRQLSDDLDKEVRHLLEPTLLAEIEAGENNLKQLGQHLRELHKAGGGLVLP